ncbi:hypothetical protein ACH4A1_30295 [Streptomyces roseoverticillatus]|uniref:hypothetical protein n=1 Tax=Streptomyces roseoverticillatus TaxID=66429 RepID=UPI0004BE6A51
MMPCTDILHDVVKKQNEAAHLLGEGKAVDGHIAQLQAANPVDQARIDELKARRADIRKRLEALRTEIAALHQDFQDCIARHL